MNNGKIRLGSALLIIKEDRILLGKRNKNPEFGRWILPGGKIEFGETHEETAIREAKEELNLDVEIKRLAGKGIYHLILDNVHRIIIYNIAIVIGGKLCSSSDISNAMFFSRNTLSQLDITDIVQRVLKDENWIY